MTDVEPHELLARAAVDALTPEESARLVEACRHDAALGTEFARAVIVERLLHAVAADPIGEIAAREVLARIESEEEEAAPIAGVIVRTVEAAHRILWRRRVAWAGAFAALLLAGGAVWAWRAHGQRPVATLVRTEAVVWRGSEPPVVLRSGVRLRADRGLFELHFNGGARVVIEAPADLELQGPGRAFLHLGRAVARVPEQARGFTLDSPRGRLVDLGTEFGVCVTPEGYTEVHVLDGVVEVAFNKSTPLFLRGSEALRTTTGTPERLRADEGAFVTAMPPVANRPPGFIHWSFDEGTGAVCANSGRRLGNDSDTRLLHRVFENASQPGPAWTDGKFGTALSLDGVDDFAESEFPGIIGSQPRTVALWVKLPDVFEPKQAFGFVSWGEILRDGAAWQISANPLAEDGAIGRLRVGTKAGWVIGTTDLRDGKWHHCAVVMYGGERPNTGTHVLLYVDGQLETASRKSVHDIHTVPAAHHGVWLGRNLAFHSDDANPGRGGRFFCGTVDEVYIFDAALGQREIEELMTRNAPPAER